jgi:hypothetical protein
LGLTLAGPILPLYWVKPAGVAKLIGAWQFFFLSGFPARQLPEFPWFQEYPYLFVNQIDRQALANMRTVT